MIVGLMLNAGYLFLKLHVPFLQSFNGPFKPHDVGYKFADFFPGRKRPIRLLIFPAPALAAYPPVPIPILEIVEDGTVFRVKSINAIASILNRSYGRDTRLSQLFQFASNAIKSLQ
ncbi:MAG: hypothetical protein ACREC0_09950 [Methylocella sp.]